MVICGRASFSTPRGTANKAGYEIPPLAIITLGVFPLKVGREVEKIPVKRLMNN